MSSNNKFDLIVIGAGVSGLSSVLHLFKNNFPGRIGLLEGRDRLGGRIHTTKTKIEEEKIEIGANWIHGIINNPIYEILWKNKLIDSNLEPDKCVYNVQARTAADGKPVDPSLVTRVYEAYGKIIKSTSKFASKNDELDIGKFGDSLGRYLQHEIDRWISDEIKTESEARIARGLFESLIKRETCISGCHSMDEVSLQYFDQYKEFLGGNITIPRGYYTLIQALLDEIQTIANDRFEYFLEQRVDTVEWPGLESSSTGDNDAVINIRCTNGEIHQCQHLIVTISLGCLKRYGPIMFQPSLPKYKLDCITRMGFGTVDKVFLEYSSKSTVHNAFTIDGVTADEIAILWPEKECADTEDGPWYEKIYSIYRITDHCVQVWVSGRQAIVLEQLTDQQINDQLTEQFRRIFSDERFPKADNVIVTRWATDDYSLGSYSYIQRGSSPDDIEMLAKPIYHKPKDEMPIIAFAGEATHKEYFSTVHGGFLSGAQVSKHFCVG